MDKTLLVTMTRGDLKELIEKTVKGVQETALKASPSENILTEKLLTRTETAKFLKVSLVTLDKWTTEGILPCHRIGFRKLYKENEILESLKAIQANKYSR